MTRGIIAEKAGAPFELTDHLPKPQPGPGQILVKSIYTAINKIDLSMQITGLLVHDWPFVPGVDAAGIVVDVGADAAAKFKVGDHVCGCTRIGIRDYGTCQEYFLMDANIAIPKPKNLSLLEAATVGLGLKAAAIGLFECLDVEVPKLQDVLDGSTQQPEQEEWAVVLGGSSSVGKFAIQLFRICGYKVITSCSTVTVELVKSLGAETAFDDKETISEQVKTVLGFTKGKVHRVFDAAASGDAFARELFKELSHTPKLFSSTNYWSEITDFEGGKTRLVSVADIGHPDAQHINKQIEAWIPMFVALFEKGELKTNPYDLIGEGGFDSVLQALDYERKGAGGSNKVVVKVQSE